MPVDGGKPVEGGRYFGWPRYRCFVAILLLTTILIFYNTNIVEMASDWSPKWWSQTAAPPNTTVSNGNNSTSQPAVTASTNETAAPVSVQTEAVRQTVGVPPSIEALRQTADVPSTTVRAATVRAATVHAVTVRAATVHATTVPTAQVTRRQTTEVKAVLPAPIPYVSPGKYVVEYPYQYHFAIDEPESCGRRKPFLVLVVPVAPHNRAARDTIRSTWGGERLILGKAVDLFFLLGRPAGDGAERVQEQVLKESGEHRDLLQGDFLDCYKNLTIKTMLMMEWLDSHCSAASYAMKIDSDMFLNVRNLVDMLLRAPKLNYLTGLVAGGAVVLRDPHSKWYLPASVFPESHYPRYALGLGYVFSLDLPKKLVAASRHVKAVYIEDVYVGLCMRHLGISPTNPPNWNLFHVSPVHYSRCAYSRLIATTTHSNMDLVGAWKDFKRPGPFC